MCMGRYIDMWISICIDIFRYSLIYYQTEGDYLPPASAIFAAPDEQ